MELKQSRSGPGKGCGSSGARGTDVTVWPVPGTGRVAAAPETNCQFLQKGKKQ